MTANPIICALHPTVEAPAASPESPNEIARAALLIGSVRIIPMMTETAMPIGRGCRVVVRLTRSPTAFIPLAIQGAQVAAASPPPIIVARGINRISSPLPPFPCTILPHRTPTRAATAAPTGSPGTGAGPAKAPAPTAPTAREEKTARGGAETLHAMLAAIAGPMRICAVLPSFVSRGTER